MPRFLTVSPGCDKPTRHSSFVLYNMTGLILQAGGSVNLEEGHFGGREGYKPFRRKQLVTIWWQLWEATIYPKWCDSSRFFVIFLLNVKCHLACCGRHPTGEQEIRVGVLHWRNSLLLFQQGFPFVIMFNIVFLSYVTL